MELKKHFGGSYSKANHLTTLGMLRCDRVIVVWQRYNALRMELINIQTIIEDKHKASDITQLGLLYRRQRS